MPKNDQNDIDVDDLTDEQVSEMLEKGADVEDVDPDEIVEVDAKVDVEPEPTTEPEQKADDDLPPAKDDDPVNAQDNDPEPEKQKTVPFATFEHERIRRKGVADDLAAANQQNAVLRDRMEQMMQQQQVPQQEQSPAAQVPDVNDPVGQINMLVERAREQDQQQAQYQEQTRQQQEQDAYIKDIYAHAERDMSAAGEEANQAYLALKESYRNEYAAMGYTDAQAQQSYSALEADHLITARQRGVPVADYIIGLARARGWQYTQAQQEQEPPAIDEIAAQVTQNEATRQKALSLGGAGGDSVGGGQLTPEQLVNMNDADFAKYLEKNKSVSVAMGVPASTDW